MSAAQKISVRRMAGALGAEVEGVHLGRMDEDTFAQVRTAFLGSSGVVLRDQEITRGAAIRN